MLDIGPEHQEFIQFQGEKRAKKTGRPYNHNFQLYMNNKKDIKNVCENFPNEKNNGKCKFKLDAAPSRNLNFRTEYK